MSAEKLKILKKIKGVDNYSKNPIIDSLIKQKLQSEMVIVKDNFNHLLRKEDNRQREPQSIDKNIRKRRLSTHNLATITPEKIRESIHFHPLDREVANFVVERQRTSPLLTEEQVEEMNKARTNNEDFFVRMKMKDMHSYEPLIESKSKLLLEKIESKVKQNLPQDLWLPSQPEVEEIADQKQQELEFSPKKLNSNFKLYLSERPSSQGYQPLLSSRSKIGSLSEIDINEITYEPKKYHKNDYISLEKWLQTAIEVINSQPPPQQTQQSSDLGNKNLIREHLNQIYTVYMCALKEVVRLTYIESAEKGLLIEKIVWSMVRLFQEIIAHQHKINFQDFKVAGKELSQLKQLYEGRMSKLEARLSEVESQLYAATEVKRNIVMSCLTYKKVNEEMNGQIDKLMGQIHQLKKQNTFFMANLLKMIKDFELRDMIKIQKTDQYNLYFYLNSQNKPQTVAKVPRDEILQRYFKKEMQNALQHKSTTLFDKDQVDQKEDSLHKLDNELTNYWEKKRDYLEINRLIMENFTTDIADAECQADGRGPSEFNQVGFQFPEEKEETFEQFLKRQLESEREEWGKKEGELKSVHISLKEVYQQAKQTITILNNQNLSLKQAIEQRDHETSYLNRKLEQLNEKNNLYEKKIAMLEKDIEQGKAVQAKMQTEIDASGGRISEQKKKFMFEKENNNILAMNNFTLKEKIEHLNKQFEDLEDRIRLVAPHLEEVMNLAESSQNNVLLKLSQMVEKHLSAYVERDANLFLTK